MLFEISEGVELKTFDDVPSPETAHIQQYDEINLATEKGIGDSGATKPIMGLDERPKWRKKITEMGFAHHILTKRCDKTFRFGNDDTATAKQMVAFPVWVRKTR